MIKFVRLITGEDLLADVSDSKLNQDTIILDKPIQVAPTEGGLAMMPFLFWATKETMFSVKKDHILVMTEPQQELVLHYQRKTGQIMVPKSQLIVS